MKHVTFFIMALCMLTGCFSLNAQSKLQKTKCNELKKQKGAKLVTTFESSPDAPYYMFRTKEGKEGIIDANGNEILSPVYNTVMYFPEFSSPESLAIPSQPTNEGFVGVSSEGTKFFDRQGRLKTSYLHNFGCFTGNYVYLCHAPYTMFYENKPDAGGSVKMLTLNQNLGHGTLVRTDGSLVIDTVDWLEYVPHTNYFLYEVIDENGFRGKGMYSIDSSEPNIPARFYNIYNRNGKWMVQARATDPYGKEYVPENNYVTGTRDRGEALFSQSKYDEVLKFYANEGINSPWAKFYSGAAMLRQSLWPMHFYKNVVEAMEKGSGLPSNEKGVINDSQTIMQMLTTSNALLQAYIESGDNNFAKEAAEELNQVAYNKTEMSNLINRYNAARGHAAMVTSQIEEQNAKAMQAIIGIFTSALNSGYSSRSSSGSNISTVASSSRAAASSSGASSAEDNSGRKAFLRGEIATWQNKLKQAESSYEQAMAGGDDSWQKKRVLESKQNTINECVNMIKQYESELNSLK